MVRPGFAVDIDNVLARAEDEVQRIFTELTGEPWPRAMYASAGGLDGSQWPREVIEWIFGYFHDVSIPRLPVLPGAVLALQLLQRRYRIILITARRPASRPQTLSWLQAHHIPFDELYLTEDKDAVPEQISLAVDDHPAHIEGYVRLGIPSFLMDQPWNRRVAPHPLVTRVGGWDDLLQALHYGGGELRPVSVPESLPVKDLLASMVQPVGSDAMNE